MMDDTRRVVGGARKDDTARIDAVLSPVMLQLIVIRIGMGCIIQQSALELHCSPDITSSLTSESLASALEPAMAPPLVSSRLPQSRMHMSAHVGVRM